MAINTQNIRIDLNPGRVIPVAHIHQNDTNRQLTFELYNNGAAFTPPSGSTVKFAYKSPIVNGQYSVITGSNMVSGAISGNIVTVTLSSDYTRVSGVGLLTMILTTSGNTLRPVNIKYVCHGSADGDDSVLGASDWPEGLYEYMDDWLAENEPTEIANLKSELTYLHDMDELRPFVTTESYPLGFRSGYYSVADGTSSTSGSYQRAIYGIKLELPFSKIRVVASGNYTVTVVAFTTNSPSVGTNADNSAIFAEGYAEASEIEITVNPNYYYYVCTNVKNADRSETTLPKVYVVSDIIDTVKSNESRITVSENDVNQLKTENQLIAVGKETFSSYSNFVQGGLNTDGSIRSSQPYRVSCINHITTDHDLIVNVKSGFRWGYIPFTNDTAGTWSGWFDSEATIPKGTEFIVQIQKQPEDTSSTANIYEFVSAVVFDTLIKNRIDDLTDFSYGYDGEALPVKTGKYNVLQTRVYHPDATIVSADSAQGFGYYNGVIVQFYKENGCALVDYSTGDTIASFTTETLHGNSVEFMSDFYDSGDDFPMAIVADGVSNKAFKVRIQTTGVTILQNIVFPQNQSGYYVSTALDALNNILYTIGYTENSTGNTSGTNTMTIAKWNINSMTDNGDNTYTPAFIDSFTVPYILSIQAPCYHNGLLYVISSYYSDPETILYAIDLDNEKIRNAITEFPQDVKANEVEGVYFCNIDGVDYAMLGIRLSRYPYYLMRFNT